MSRVRFVICRILIVSFFLTVSLNAIYAQTRMIVNGAVVTMNQGVFLVIDNPAADAITRNSGHIISEGENNRIRWNMGTTTGTYIIPWGYSTTDYIPLTFTKAAGTGSGGYFLFSTYHTAWNNISQLPTGVTNIDGVSGTDNSKFASDRFWQINAQSYTTKPALSNLEFTYLDAENAAPNIITESNLKAKRYNSVLNSWIDNILAGSINTTTNKFTVTSVNAANLQAWWMLGGLSTARYWVALSNSNSNLASNWSETSGGVGNADVPALGDSVVFDGAGIFNCTVDANLSASSLTVSSGYSGLISQGASVLTLNNDAIFSGGTFMGGSSNLFVNGNFTVSGASFIAPSASLDVKQDFNVSSGSFAHNNGTVVFSGTNATTQNITSTTTTTFNNISATNTAASPGVSVQSNQNLKGILTLASNVNFDADGSGNTAVFKLLSAGDNPTQDAAVNILPSGAVVSGDVTVQRFMTKEGWANTRIYRYISSPVQDASVSDLQQEIPVSGNFSGRSLCSGCSLNQSLFAYDETVITDVDGNHILNEHDGYINFPDVSNTETFQPGRGYALFVRGNILSSTSWDLRGPINTGNNSLLSIPVSYTSSGTLANDGWNLVGNPFPSTIDWNASSGWTKTNVDGSIYITDNGNAAQQIATWNGVTGTNGGSRYLATGQGFWIKANGSGSPVLRASENIKAPGTQTAYIRQGGPENLLRITMVGGPTRDEAVIHFRDDATENFDTGADAIKLENGTFNLASLQPDGRKLAINSISPLQCASEIRLSVENTIAGIYRLNFSEFESFPDVVAITLEDTFTSNSLNIRNGGYDFSVTSNPASYGSGRFKVKFGPPQANSDFIVSAAPICQGSEGTIQIDNSQNGATYIATTGHGALSAPVVGNGSSIMIRISSDSLLAGQNDISIQSTWPGCSAMVEKSFTLMSVETNDVISVTGGKICREGVTILNATGAPADGHYNWYESESSTSQLEEHGSSFTTPALVKSKTYFVTVANSLGCEGMRTSVLAEVMRFDDAYIEAGQSGESLVSNFATGNQWYFNGQLIQGAIEQSITPQQSGVYGLSVDIDGCTSHADYDYLITGTESPSQQRIRVFPNPVHKDVKIFLPDSYKDIKELEIINSIGLVVGFIKMEGQNNERSLTYDMTGLPSGVYILRATKETGVIEVRLVKQ